MMNAYPITSGVMVPLIILINNPRSRTESDARAHIWNVSNFLEEGSIKLNPNAFYSSDNRYGIFIGILVHICVKFSNEVRVE